MRGVFSVTVFFVPFSENQLVEKMRKLFTYVQVYTDKEADISFKTQHTSFQTLATFRMALFTVNSLHWASSAAIFSM